MGVVMWRWKEFISVTSVWHVYLFQAFTFFWCLNNIRIIGDVIVVAVKQLIFAIYVVAVQVVFYFYFPNWNEFPVASLPILWPHLTTKTFQLCFCIPELIGDIAFNFVQVHVTQRMTLFWKTSRKVEVENAVTDFLTLNIRINVKEPLRYYI